MRELKMKVNPEKCTFGVPSGNFLGCLVTKRGIEVDPEKVRAIQQMPSPQNLKQVQKLNGRLAAMNRFLARSSDKCKPFFDILKKESKFAWTIKCEDAFTKIKTYLASIPILQRPEPKEVLTLYITATINAVSAVLVRTKEREEIPVYYISKTFSPAERNYTKMEQLILALLFATQKLRTYFLTHTVRVLTVAPLENVLKHTQKVGRVEKWNIQLEQFDIVFERRTAQKSQILADFLADLPLEYEMGIDDIPNFKDKEDLGDVLTPVNIKRWEVFVDGSSNNEGAGIGVVITTPAGQRMIHAFRLEFEKHTNNVVEYEALVHALKLILELGISNVRLTSDSQLVIKQIDVQYHTLDETMEAYMNMVQKLASQIEDITFRHLSRKDNRHTDALAFISSMLRDPEVEAIKIGRIYEPSIQQTPLVAVTAESEDEAIREYIHDEADTEMPDPAQEIITPNNPIYHPVSDWRIPIHYFLEDETLPTGYLEARKVAMKATNYQLRDGILYKKTFLGPLLRCLSRSEGYEILKDIHYGDAANHAARRSLALKAKAQGYYWPTMNADAADMSKRCEECQRWTRKIRAPTTELNSVLSPWPFLKWGIDIVVPFIPGTKKRKYLIVAVDYFTKWVEEKATANIADTDIFTFVFQNIICRFGIPAEIITDNGAQFKGKQIKILLETFKIQMHKSTPIYPQSNGQVEAANKVIVLNIKKTLDGHKHNWCEQLHNTLWAYRTTRREPTGESPFLLTYGAEAVIPTEIILPTTKRRHG
ncbi:uncharacterized protein LOC113345668 [Papaver somniferum]|uniref:uncharacterized protein LOC113345668 n=1 Tax=Papaver somniferum TaxID=3469 RepID=UPI000E6F8CF4|nr:uncharacterized protein LOC113345668 [Papaver somniferum]